jgi:GNAT superfamily N-acetyltransferase
MLASLQQDDNRARWARSYAAQPQDYVGAPAQQMMQKLAYGLWQSLRYDRRYAYEGRLVAIDGADRDDVGDLLHLARGQGAAVNWYVPNDDVDALCDSFCAMGYSTDRWDQHWGAADAIRAARRVRETVRCPEGYAIGTISADTPDAVVAAFGAFAAEHGVMVPAAHVMRGVTRACVAKYATAPDGGIVAIAGSVLGHHHDHPLADSAWWGMLCTHADHRGRGLSKILGALVMLDMAERHGATSFYTGVRSDNHVSQSVCNSLGVCRSEYSVVMVVSPDLAGSGPVTR